MSQYMVDRIGFALDYAVHGETPFGFRLVNGRTLAGESGNKTENVRLAFEAGDIVLSVCRDCHLPVQPILGRGNVKVKNKY